MITEERKRDLQIQFQWARTNPGGYIELQDGELGDADFESYIAELRAEFAKPGLVKIEKKYPSPDERIATALERIATALENRNEQL